MNGFYQILNVDRYGDIKVHLGINETRLPFVTAVNLTNRLNMGTYIADIELTEKSQVHLKPPRYLTATNLNVKSIVPLMQHPLAKSRRWLRQFYEWTIDGLNPLQMTESEIHCVLEVCGLFLKKITNPTYQMKIKACQNDGRVLRFISRHTYPIAYAAVKNYPLAVEFLKLDDLNEQEIYKLFCLGLKKESSVVRFIPNPTEELQLLAVCRDGLALRHIQNPSEKVCIEAIKQHGRAIIHVTNPTFEMKLLAYGRDPEMFYKLPLTHELCLEAVTKNYRCLVNVPIELISFPILSTAIKDIPKTSMNYFITKDHIEQLKPEERKIINDAIHCRLSSDNAKMPDSKAEDPKDEDLSLVINQTEEFCWEWLRQDIRNIRFIRRPTFEMCAKAIQENPWNLELLYEPNEKIILMALALDPWCFRIVLNPTNEMALMVRQKNANLSYICPTCI